jgi:hypothetical protein
MAAASIIKGKTAFYCSFDAKNWQNIAAEY